MLGWHAFVWTVGVRALGTIATAQHGLVPGRGGHCMRTRGCSNSITLCLALCLLIVLLPQMGLAGTYCGSDATPLAKLFKETSSDWWPDVGLMDIYSAGKVIAGVGELADYLSLAGNACVVYGQAYLGEACCGP